MIGLRTLVAGAVLVAMGSSAAISEAALAKANGGSGLSGKLSSNKAIKKQQLICDPDDPLGGSASVAYDPTIVSFSDVSFGPGYTGTAYVEVNNDGESFLQNYLSFQDSPRGVETGYAQVIYETPTSFAAARPRAFGHGQIPVATGYTTVDEGGPAGVDSHAFLFSYRDGVPDSTVAEYTVYADLGRRSSGNTADYLDGLDDQGNFFHVDAADIAPVTVRGSLNAIPLPPAVLAGGMTMAGLLVSKARRRRAGR